MTTSDLSDNDRTIRVYRLKTAFAESSATWNESASGVNWQSAGASGANDRESTDIGSVLVLANEADGTEKQISLDAAKVQEMVSGTFTNNGFIIIADTELNDRFNYKSSDASTASQRPKLVIQYTTSTPTPGPSPTPTNTPAGPTATPTRTPTPSQTPTVAPTTPSPTFQNATFVYDGDGRRVKSTFNGTTTTYFVGAHYEVTGSTVTKYYYAGAQRIAMRSNGTLSYLLGDHLGSTSLTTDAAGDIVSEIRYKAWGTVRYATENVPTKYQYTGQFSYEAEFGLYFYNARWYDPYLNHFTQPDSIVPDPSNPQAWDRYSYARNNPIRYTDPTGHTVDCGLGDNCEELNRQVLKIRYAWRLEGRWKLKELDTIYETGRDIETYIDDLTDGQGQEWMLDYLGDITILHDDNDGESSYALPTFRGTRIWLGKGWLNEGGWESHQLLAHELGHVWDIRQFMQGSIKLHEELGGSGFPWPFRKPDTNVPVWGPLVNDGKGNTGMNEYFAEAFSWTIYDETSAPRDVPTLIDEMITNQASMIGEK